MVALFTINSLTSVNTVTVTVKVTETYDEVDEKHVSVVSYTLVTLHDSVLALHQYT